MLSEPQTNELLESCERSLGQRLTHTRAQLTNPDQRAGAIWELMVVEAVSSLGESQYEPGRHGSPDVRVQLGSGRAICFEATFIYPKFQSEERATTAAFKLIFAIARERGIRTDLISVRFDGDTNPAAGYVRALPLLHEMRAKIVEVGILEFFNLVSETPEVARSCKLHPYSIMVKYDPRMQPYAAGFHGLVQEAAKTVERHAVFQRLQEKEKRRKPNEPYVIALGGDDSHALSRAAGPGCVSYVYAVQEIFRQYTRVSAALIVRVENRPDAFLGLVKQARGEMFLNSGAAHPLTVGEQNRILAMNFNRRPFGLAFSRS